MTHWKGRNRHKFLLQFHLIFVCKYRKNLLSFYEISEEIKRLSKAICARHRILAYKEFEIPKKSGGVRRITAPTGKLKGVLKCLSQILASYYEPQESAHGFIPRRGLDASRAK